MAEFLDCDSVKSELSRILKKSKEFIYIVSPYVDFTARYKAIIKDASEQGMEIKLIYGKNRMKKPESEWFQTVDGIEVRFLKDLHAKCYMNENTAIITSMNIYEFSMNNNFEMGIVIREEQEPAVYAEILEEVRRLIRISELQKPAIRVVDEKEPIQERKTQPDPKPKETEVEGKPWNNNAKGYCIRCGERIPLDPKTPYCSRCMKSWNRYKNPDYIEKAGVCHSCGKSLDYASMNTPICMKCKIDQRIDELLTFKGKHNRPTDDVDRRTRLESGW